MWNTTAVIAKSMLLPEKEFTAFAIEHAARFSVHVQFDGTAEVSNFHVDALIEAFRAQNAELCDNFYREKIAEITAVRDASATTESNVVFGVGQFKR